MTPQVLHGDCRTILPTLPKGTIITDPPYNVGYDYDGYSDNMPMDDYLDMIVATCPQPCVIIHYPEFLCQVSIRLGVPPTRMVAWVYPSNTARQWRAVGWWGCDPDFTKDSQEYRNPTDKRIMQLMAEGKRARLYDWWEVDQVKNVSADKCDHPCQIPLSVMRRIIKITAPQLVIDPYCGTGTTLLAAMELGVPSIGIELGEKYHRIAVQRTAPLLNIVA